jgi:multisubunit Na+/H+ antiporter MnhG subunit
MDKLGWLIVIVTIVVIQFGLALCALVRLAYCNYSNTKYIKYNLLSVLLVLIGPMVTMLVTNSDYRAGKVKSNLPSNVVDDNQNTK